jgi:ATP-dependent protease Clp ATPase subunit
MKKAKAGSRPRCSFCKRQQTAKRQVVAGPNDVFICKECVDLYKAALTKNASTTGDISV